MPGSVNGHIEKDLSEQKYGQMTALVHAKASKLIYITCCSCLWLICTRPTSFLFDKKRGAISISIAGPLDDLVNKRQKERRRLRSGQKE